MKRSAIRLAPRQLQARGLDPGHEDGLLGPRTRAALDRVEKIPPTWPVTRKAVAFIQLLALENGIDTGSVDGYWGHLTDYAFGCLARKLDFGAEPILWRPEDLCERNPNGWPRQTPQENLFRFYGETGRHQARIRLPYPHRLAWNKKTVIHGFSCPKKSTTVCSGFSTAFWPITARRKLPGCASICGEAA